jgi:PhnB protein
MGLKRRFAAGVWSRARSCAKYPYDQASLDKGKSYGRQPIPEGHHTAIPYVAVDDAPAAIVYKRAFGATERMRMSARGGKIGHAEIEIGDSMIMLSDPFPQATTRPPKELGGSRSSVFLHVEDVDAAFQRAVDARATVAMAPADMFWGDRFGSLIYSFGHNWSLVTHKEDLAEEEIAERGQAAMA